MRIATLLFTLCFSALSYSQINGFEVQPDNLHPKVEMQTNLGTLVIELNREKARATVDNFLGYVANGRYDNTLFHRIIAGFVVQGGGYDLDAQSISTGETITNESKNGLSNDIGTIAMARTNAPHSANSQFYFNVANNYSLNGSEQRWGYAVFGKVISGMDVLNALAAVPVGSHSALPGREVPVKPTLIEKATILPAQ